MDALSKTHLVLIPTYNSGVKLELTVTAALRCWQPVWVVVDASTDGSDEALTRLAAQHTALRVFKHQRNLGKGASVLTALREAQREGFQFALVMDADGQHPPEQIRPFMELSARNPDAMILGEPVFGTDAPASRKYGRLAGNWWTNLATLWGGIHDSLFGFRVYPIGASLRIFDSIRGGRRYDFDTQLAVRLYWAGVRPVNVPVPVRYFTSQDGGTSHFKYLRDNLLLVLVHTGLFFGMLIRLPKLRRFRQRR
jgi:glycosyltransferase involved in cell wall biosynthesis